MAAKALPADNDSELVRELRLQRAQIDEMQRERDRDRAERDRDRAEIAMLRSAVRTATGRDPEPAIHRSQHTGGNWSDYPTHDQAYVDAAVKFGTASAEAKAALRAATERCAARQRSIPRPSDFEAADKRRNASLDMTGVPVAPGGTFNRDPQTGQIHISYPQPVTCELGHPAVEGKPFCPRCGGPVGSPALARDEEWAATPEAERSLRDIRIAEEG